MFKFVIYILAFSSVGLLCSQAAPFILDKLQRLQDKNVDEAEKKLDTMFLRVNKEKLFLFYTISPVVFGLAALLLFEHIIFTLVGVVLGLFIPAVFIKNMEAQRKQRFQAQLVDGLMVLSSSLKGAGGHILLKFMQGGLLK